MMYPTTAAVRQDCTRGVLLPSSCLVPVICGVGKISDTKRVDLKVRIDWCIITIKNIPILPLELAGAVDMLWTCGRNGSTQQNYGVWWGDKWHAPIKAITYYNSSHTRTELQAAADARGLDCCWAAGSYRGALCQNREMYVYPSSSRKTRFASQSYVRTRGSGVQKPNPRGCCGNPGICLKCAQGQNSLKGLPRATHCTDRAQTSGNVTPTVELCPPHPTFRTKVRARRDVPEEKTK